MLTVSTRGQQDCGGDGKVCTCDPRLGPGATRLPAPGQVHTSVHARVADAGKQVCLGAEKPGEVRELGGEGHREGPPSFGEGRGGGAAAAT